MSATDSVQVTTVVSVDPMTAFAVFTEEVDQWWKLGPRFRGAGGTLRFEPGEGGRLVQTDLDGSEFELGRVQVWKPGESLLLVWRNRNFEPDQETEVEVTFEKAGSGTRVTIEHRGWDTLPADHPARHGLEGEAFSAMMGVWWGDQAVSLRLVAAARAA